MGIIFQNGFFTGRVTGLAPTFTPTATPTNTPTSTVTPTVTPTNTQTPTPTVTQTLDCIVGATFTEIFEAPSPTPSPTNTVTPTNSVTPSITPTNTVTPTNSITPTNTVTPTNTIAPTITPTRTITPTPSITPTITPTNTITPTPSITATITPTNTITPTRTVTPTITPSTVITYNAGLFKTTYAGYFADNVSFFATATPTAYGANPTTSVQTTAITEPSTDDGSNFSVQWLGFFKPTTTETYTFFTNSDDASYMWIGANALSGFSTANATVNNGGLHANVETSGTAALTAGIYYPIRMQFGESGGGDVFGFNYSTATITKTTNVTGLVFYNSATNGF